MPRIAVPAVDRIFKKIQVNPLGCWEWQGALLRGRYGVVQLGRGVGTDLVHRVVYSSEVGPIPPTLTIDHLCANTRCCNPTHLEAVTHSENVRRQWRDGRVSPHLKKEKNR